MAAPTLLTAEQNMFLTQDKEENTTVLQDFEKEKREQSLAQAPNFLDSSSALLA